MMSLFPKSIRVPVEDIKECARKMQDLSDNVEDYFDRLSNLTLSVKGNKQWEGKSVEALVGVNATNKIKYEELMNNMAEMAKHLRAYAIKMETVDREQARKIRSIS